MESMDQEMTDNKYVQESLTIAAQQSITDLVKTWTVRVTAEEEVSRLEHELLVAQGKLTEAQSKTEDRWNAAVELAKLSGKPFTQYTHCGVRYVADALHIRTGKVLKDDPPELKAGYDICRRIIEYSKNIFEESKESKKTDE